MLLSAAWLWPVQQGIAACSPLHSHDATSHKSGICSLGYGLLNKTLPAIAALAVLLAVLLRSLLSAPHSHPAGEGLDFCYTP